MSSWSRRKELMIKEWSPEGTVAQMLNALSSYWRGLSAAWVSQEERKIERYTAFYFARESDPRRMA